MREVLDKLRHFDEVCMPKMVREASVKLDVKKLVKKGNVPCSNGR